jgi:hypothetical protein
MEVKTIYDKNFEDMQKFIDNQIKEYIESEMFRLFGLDSEGAYTSAVKASEPFTKEKLDNLIEQLKPYNKAKEDLYKFAVPKLEIKFDDSKEMDRFLYSYGMPVLKPTKTIIIKIQRRKHKSKRINKKWLKRYGYKEVKREVPNYGFINYTGA